MIDTDKYEGHSTGWKHKTNHSTYSIINDDGHKVASIGAWTDVWKDKSAKDSQLIADAPLLLAEVKRYRKTLERIAREDYNQNHYEHTEERHIWNMMHNMIQQARMALGQDIDTGELRAEEFEAEEYFEYHVYVVDDDEIGDMYIVDNARDFETKEEAIKAAHEVSKDERGKGKTVYIVAEDRENDYEEVFYEINEEGDVMMAEDFGADEYKGKQIYTQLNEFLSQFKKISIKGKPYIVVYEWDNYYEVYPLTEVYGFMGALRSKLKQWENHKGYAPQKIITKKGYAQPTQNYYDMRTGKWVEDNAWTYEYAGKPGTQAEVRELTTHPNYNAEEFGAESNCSCGNRFINQCYVCDTQICAYCNYNNSAKCDKCYEGDDSHWAEEFGAEFSRGEMLNLRKYIDYPMRWVNKNIRPSSDSKERKTEQKMKGQIPRRKSPDSFRNTIETPTWFKGIQIGILATIFGAMYVSETNKKRKK